MDVEELKRRVDGRTTFELSELSEDLLREADCWDRVLVVPNANSERVSYIADALVQMVTNIPKNDNLRYVVDQLTQSLCYLMNSASWREDELHDFDLAEIRSKLGRIAQEGKPDESA